MLSSALNFLSDKRKRFHRSDTMPSFGNELNLFKSSGNVNKDFKSVKDDNNILSDVVDYIDVGSHEDNEQQEDRNEPFPYLAKTNDDIISFRIDKTSPSNDGNSTANSSRRSKSPYSHYDSGDYMRKTPMIRHEFGGSDNDLTCRFREEHAEFGGKHARKNQDAKLQFLNIPQKRNHTVDLPCQSQSNSCTDSSPSPSINSCNSSILPSLLRQDVRDDLAIVCQQNIRAYSKENNAGTEEPEVSYFRLPNTESVHFKEPETKYMAIDNIEDKETTSEQTQKLNVGGKSRVARMRAKAVARATKSKVKRSKSSVHVSRRSRGSPCDETGRGRSSSARRKTTDSLPVQDSGGDHKLDISQVDFNPIDRNHRSKSVTSPGLDSDTATTFDIKETYDMLCQLANRATKKQHYRIDAMEPSISKTEALKSDLPLLTDDHASDPKISSLGMPLQDTTSMLLAHSKLNKYAVVRRLRRNNSSLTYSSEKSFGSLPEEPINSTFSSAGDLLLPSKQLKLQNIMARQEEKSDKKIHLIVGQLFDLVKTDNLDRFLRDFGRFRTLLKNYNPDSEVFINELELNPLDCALLSSSISLIVCLMLCGFNPGPVLQFTLDSGPFNIPKADSMEMHLKNLLKEAEGHLSDAQIAAKEAISRANELVSSLSQTASPESNSTLLISINNAFSEVGLKERALNQSLTKRDFVKGLGQALGRYPIPTPPPRMVRVMLEGPNSILIRINPPRPDRLQEFQHVKNTVFDEKSSCTSDESDLEENEGRKIGNSFKQSYSNLIIRYRIEWSHCPKFLNAEVRGCTVEPPYRLDGFTLNGHVIQIKSNTCPALCTAFYSIYNMTPNKMTFVRVYAFSVRGWSKPCYATPNGISPSAWYDSKFVISAKHGSSKEPKLMDDGVPSSPMRYVGDRLITELETQKRLLAEKISSWLCGTSPSQIVNSSPEDAATGVTNNGNFGSGTLHGNVNGSPSIGNMGPLSGMTAVGSGSASSTGGSGGVVGSGGGSKRTRSPMLQRKRSFRFLFSNKCFRFVKQTKSGVYIAVLCHTPTNIDSNSQNIIGDISKTKCQIVLSDDNLPMINVTREDFTNTSTIISDFNWFSRLVCDTSVDMDAQMLSEGIPRSCLPTNLQFRIRLLEALQHLRFAFGTSNVGCVYPELIKVKYCDQNSQYFMKPTKCDSEDVGDKPLNSRTGIELSETSQSEMSSTTRTHSAILIVLLKQVNNTNELGLTGNLRWISLDKLLRQNKIKINDFLSCYTNSNLHFLDHINSVDRDVWTTSLYSHLLVTKSDQLLLTPEIQLITNLDLLLYYSEHRSVQLQPGLYFAILQMRANLDQQATLLVSRSSDVIHLFPVQRIRTRTHVSREEWELLFKLLDKHENGEENAYEIRDSERRFIVQLLRAWSKLSKRMNYPPNVAINFRIYLPEIIRISNAHAIIPVLPSLDQVCLPPGSTLPTPKLCMWLPMAHVERNLSLIYDPLFQPQISHLLAILELLIPICQFMQRQCFNDAELAQCTERTQTMQAIQSNLEGMLQSKRWLSETIAAGRDRKRAEFVTLSFERLIHAFHTWLPESLTSFLIQPEENEKVISPQHFPPKSIPISPSVGTEEKLEKSESPEFEEVFKSEIPSAPTSRDNYSGSVLQIYVQYNSGLASGTSVRLLVNGKTTAKEIVDVVVKQITQTVQKKNRLYQTQGSSDYSLDFQDSNDSDQSFCLIVSLGNIERRLPDTIHPLLLRKPWRSGKFSVRYVKDWELDNRQNGKTPTQQVAQNNVYKDSAKHTFHLTVVENAFDRAQIGSPPTILQ